MNRFILIVVLLAGCGSLRTSKSIKTTVDKFADGKTKTITQVETRTNKDFELHENFKETTTTVRAYFHNGKLRYETKITHHNGLDYPCREALYKLKQYDSTGVKRLFIKNECDCHKQVEITWNAKGKVLAKTKKVVKRLY
ncbi:MAG TPA: hypothetical protein VK177_19420 [Flavobacteriales bacterium]|nr:hypothetical protein [Flavobacteriales bacterium]